MQSTFVLQQRTLTKLDKEEKILSAQGWVASLVCVCVCVCICVLMGLVMKALKLIPGLLLSLDSHPLT